MGVGFLQKNIPSEIKASLSQVSWQREWESRLQSETGFASGSGTGREGKKRVLNCKQQSLTEQDFLETQCPVRMSWPVKLLSGKVAFFTANGN